MRKHLRSRRSDEEAFTLVELLVVVLILGILMAIAIPTFLSLTGGAKTNAAVADLTTASQDEAAYLSAYSVFDATSSPNTAADNISATVTPVGMKGTDPGINWIAATSYAPAAAPFTATVGPPGTKTVWVDMLSSAGTALILGTAAANGNTYWVSDNLGTLTYAFNTTAAAIVPTTATSSWYTSWKAAVVVTP